MAVLLPVDPDASARRLRDAFAATADVAVIITDSFGRPFRLGTTGVAVGCAGLAPVRVHTGERDDAGRVLQGTEVHVADQIALGRGARHGALRRRARGASCAAWRSSAPTPARAPG